jgi:hypothetical protein
VAAAGKVPVFFDPPPPVGPVSPGIPLRDLPFEAPAPAPGTNPVDEVSGEGLVTVPPPPVSVITQPIQVHSRPGSLPELRAEVSGTDSLPRLDVSLAGHDLSAASALLFGESADHSHRTRVQLPQPGAETQKFSPDDFIVPSETSLEAEEVPEVIPALHSFDSRSDDGDGDDPDSLPYLHIPLPALAVPGLADGIEVPSDDDLPNSEPLVSFDSYAAPDFREEHEYLTNFSGGEAALLDLDAAAWSEEELAGAFVPDAASEVSWSHLPVPPPDEGDFAEFEGSPRIPEFAPQPGFHRNDHYDEVPADPLHEGSFAPLFSGQSDRGEGGSAPVDPEAHLGSSFFEARGPVFAPSAHSGDPVSPGAETKSPSDGGLLGELLGGGRGGPGEKAKLSKTAVVVISCLVGAVVIAILMVVLLGQLFLGDRATADAPGEEIAVETKSESAKGSNTATAFAAESVVDDPPAIIDPVAVPRVPVARATNPEETADAPALSIDERVQRIVSGGVAAGGTGASVIGQPSLDLVDDAIARFSTNTALAPTAAVSSAASPPAPVDPATPGTVSEREEVPVEATPGPLAGSGKSANYNPPASFPAPGPTDSPILRTNDLIDAFLRAPDWETRVKYTYRGDSLRPAIEDYHKKWPDSPPGRYSLQLFQMEPSVELGGPYWVYLVSSNDADQGFPLIIRVEEGNLKVDWEIYSEFHDRHFARFRDGKMPGPATFRVVIERVSDYYGTDRAAFTNLKDHYVYQINPPYGDLNEFSEYAFVKKDSELAKKLDGVIGLGDEPLAVIVTLDKKAFEHGVKHFVITDYLTEGWFR